MPNDKICCVLLISLLLVVQLVLGTTIPQNHEEDIENFNPQHGMIHNTVESPSFVFRGFITGLAMLCFLMAAIFFVLLRLNEEDGQNFWTSEENANTSTNIDLPSRWAKQAQYLMVTIGVSLILYAWTVSAHGGWVWPGFLLIAGTVCFCALIRLAFKYAFYLRKQEEERKQSSFSNKIKRFYHH